MSVLYFQGTRKKFICVMLRINHTSCFLLYQYIYYLYPDIDISCYRFCVRQLYGDSNSFSPKCYSDTKYLTQVFYYEVLFVLCLPLIFLFKYYSLNFHFNNSVFFFSFFYINYIYIYVYLIIIYSCRLVM